jgi:hypothetical protein
MVRVYVYIYIILSCSCICVLFVSYVSLCLCVVCAGLRRTTFICMLSPALSSWYVLLYVCRHVKIQIDM